MIEKVITTAIGFVVTGALGYCVSSIKILKEKKDKKDEEENTIKTALMTMLQSNLTNTYFAYSGLKEIPDYVYKNWLNELKVYESLGGDDYVHTLAAKMQEWEISHTDILK